jgi:uncharacterized protein YndB with AHSA1/START domain
MSQTTKQPDTTLRIVRVFPAPRARVFKGARSTS